MANQYSEDSLVLGGGLNYGRAPLQGPRTPLPLVKHFTLCNALDFKYQHFMRTSPLQERPLCVPLLLPPPATAAATPTEPALLYTYRLPGASCEQSSAAAGAAAARSLASQRGEASIIALILITAAGVSVHPHAAVPAAGLGLAATQSFQHLGHLRGLQLGRWAGGQMVEWAGG